VVRPVRGLRGSRCERWSAARRKILPDRRNETLLARVYENVQRMPARDECARFAESEANRLARLAFVLTGQREAAEDLTQEALLTVVRKWNTVARVENRSADVRRVLVNRYLGDVRRNHVKEVSIGDMDGPAVATPVVSLVDHDQVWRALADISPRQRAALVLRYYEDLDDRTTAQVLGCRPSRYAASSLVASPRSATVRNLRTTTQWKGTCRDRSRIDPAGVAASTC